MNDMNVPNMTLLSSRDVLARLGDGLDGLTPELRKAAAFVLENPNEVSLCSIREISEAAGVKPNSFVRMARSIGFEGYDDFREPFRQDVRRGLFNFPDRARWLQSLSKGGRHGELYSEMAASALANVEATFTETNVDRLKKAANAILKARRAFVLGVGVNHAIVRNFAYLADMAVDNVTAIPRDGNLAIDEISRATRRDVLVAMTFKPYRSEVVDAVELARELGLTLIGISDSPASPLITGSDLGFVVPTDTPQFFTSTIALQALLETLMAFVVAGANTDVAANIETFHERRRMLGIYRDDTG